MKDLLPVLKAVVLQNHNAFSDFKIKIEEDFEVKNNFLFQIISVTFLLNSDDWLRADPGSKY